MKKNFMPSQDQVSLNTQATEFENHAHSYINFFSLNSRRY